MGDRVAAEFKLEIFRTGAGNIRIKMDAVGHFRHQHFAEACGNPMVVVFNNGAVGVAARIRRIVVGAVVVHSPVQELQMTI